MSDQTSNPRNAALQGLPIEIKVSVGHARPLLRDLMGLNPNAILPLDTRIEDPVRLYVGDKCIAEGELVEADGAQAGELAVRVTRMVDSGDAGP